MTTVYYIKCQYTQTSIQILLVAVFVYIPVYNLWWYSKNPIIQPILENLDASQPILSNLSISSLILILIASLSYCNCCNLGCAPPSNPHHQNRTGSPFPFFSLSPPLSSLFFFPSSPWLVGLHLQRLLLVSENSFRIAAEFWFPTPLPSCLSTTRKKNLPKPKTPESAGVRHGRPTAIFLRHFSISPLSWR